MSDRSLESSEGGIRLLLLALVGLAALGFAFAATDGRPVLVGVEPDLPAAAGELAPQRPSRLEAAPATEPESPRDGAEGTNGSAAPVPANPRAAPAQRPVRIEPLPAVPEDLGSPLPIEDGTDPPAVTTGSPDPATRGPGESRSASASSLDQDELTEIGELGFLPGLMQALSPASDCVFDDALSTCQ